MSSSSWVNAWRADLPVTGCCVYFQTASRGPVSRSVLDVLHDADRLAASRGPAAPAASEPLIAASTAARESLARLLGVPTRELGWSFNTSTAMRTVFHSLRPNQGNRVITSDLEHVATRSLCGGLHDAAGVTVAVVAADGSDDDFLSRLEHALHTAGAARTIVLLSHVSCIDGRRLPVARAATLAREHGAVSVIDGAQAAGQIPVDVGRIGADFYIGSAHKWLLGPSGIGYIHVRADRLGSFNPNWLPAAERDRATAGVLGEAGSMNPALRAALRSAVDHVQAIGLDAIEAHVRGLAEALRAGLRSLRDIEVLGPDEPARQTGLVGFRAQAWTAGRCQAIVDALYREHGILIKYQPERTALRVSLAAFNTMEEVEMFLRAFRAIHSRERSGS